MELSEITLKEVMSGRYRDYFLIYNRKSTDDILSQKNSISYQKVENTRFALSKNLPIAPITIKNFCADGIISEKHSGFKEDNDIIFSDDGMVQYRIDRPKFQKLLQLVSQGYFKGIICLCWDRISRNKGDDTLIRKLMTRGVDIQFSYASYDKTSSGALHMDIDGMFAQHHSRVTSEKVTITTRNSREKGLCTYKAPISYLNEGNMNHKPFDPVRSPIIKQMFIYYATGSWSLTDLERYAKDQGLVTVPMRRRRTDNEMLAEEDELEEIEQVSRLLTANNIGRILSNPFYTGRILDSNGKYIPSNSHEALVDDELFKEVQAVLKKKKVSIHYTEKVDQPLRGIVRCKHCDRVYTPYTKKGIQYYGSRCTNGCDSTFKSFNFSYIAKEVEKLMDKLYFSEEEIADADAHIETDIALFEHKRHKELEQVERRKKTIRENLAYMSGNKISLLKTGVYTPEAFLEEERKLNDDLSELKNDEDVSDIAMYETKKDVYTLSELVKNAIPHYRLANPQEKERIVRIIFSELYISENTLQYKCRKGFECLEDHLRAVCDPTESRTPLTGMKSRCPNR